MAWLISAVNGTFKTNFVFTILEPGNCAINLRHCAKSSKKESVCKEIMPSCNDS